MNVCSRFYVRPPFDRFVFYDLETTGLSVPFDQILQLAAIRTGPAFLDDGPDVETENLRVRRARSIVPSPAAMLTTRLKGADLDSGLPFVSAMGEANALFRAWAPATFIGYNNVRYDDDVIRHNFYRALQSPFVMQTGGSTRADLMRIAQAISVVESDTIVVPKREDGRSSFRLGPLARANGVLFDEAEAHDALADVRATMALARVLKQGAPAAFEWALGLAERARARDALLQPPCVLELRMVAGAPVVRPLVVVSGLEVDPNAYLCADLSVDPDRYLNLDADALRALIESPQSPIVKIRVNTHPLLWPLASSAPGVDKLLPLIHRRELSGPVGGATDPHLDSGELERRAFQVFGAMDFAVAVRGLVEAMIAARPGGDHIEQQLYDRFADRLDYHDCGKFVAGDRDERRKAYGHLRDWRLREFATRILYDEAPDMLPLGERDRLDGWLHDRVLGPRDAPWRTIAQAREELVSLRADHPDEAERLDDIEAYLDVIAQSAPHSRDAADGAGEP